MDEFNMILDGLDFIEDDEFPNHAAVGAEYVTVSDCARPEIAENNCWAVSTYIEEQFTGELEAVTLGFCNNDVHVALLHHPSHQIIDYTMRQFDEDTDFPYVADQDAWRTKVETYMKENRSTSLSYLSLGSNFES